MFSRMGGHQLLTYLQGLGQDIPAVVQRSKLPWGFFLNPPCQPISDRCRGLCRKTLVGADPADNYR